MRLGDHARANDAFAKARAANDAAERARGRLFERDGSSVDVSREANKSGNKKYARAHVNARAVASAFAPVVVAVLESETPESDVSSYASLKCVLDDVLSKGNSARGGVLIVLGTVPEAAVKSVRRRCEGLGLAYVQCALVDFDEAHIVCGAVDVWVASADGPTAMNCAEAVVLGAIAGGAEFDFSAESSERNFVGDGISSEENAEASADANGHSNPRIRRLASGDPRDAASPRAAVLASLLAAQAEEIRNMRASAATAAEAKAMRALRDDADAAAKEAFKRAAIETDRASFLELALQQERRERERLKETLEHAHRQKTSELERDHARDRARFAAAETTLRTEIDARGADADEIRARFESQSVIFFETRTEEQRLRTELELLTLAYDRLAVEKRTTTDRLTSRVDALRDALGASRAEADDLTRLLSGEEKTNPLHFEDAFLARDRAEADATAVRGQLAEAVTEQRRWRARCDAAERRAVEAEKRAEKDAMRAVVADARAASFRDTMRVNPGKSDESSLTNEEVLDEVFASPHTQPGQQPEQRRERPTNDVSPVVHPALVETPGPGVGATPGPAAPRYLPAPAFSDLETRVSSEMNVSSFPGREAADSGDAEEEQKTRPPSSASSGQLCDLDLALSRAAAAEEKLLACEAKLRLAETATTDAENRAGRVKLLANTERHENRDFEATVSGLKRAILEARAETRAAKAAAEAETKTARESVLFSEAAAREIVEVETKRRVAAERERDDAREDAAFSRKRADSVRAEAERLLERAEIVEDETSFPYEDEKKKNGGLGEDARVAKTGVAARVAVPATPEDVSSEREAVLFAAARCAELEREMPGARACVARKTTSHKLAVVAAGAMSPLVRWFGARGWSSKVARGSLAHVCLSAMARERTANGRRAYERTVSTRLRRVSTFERDEERDDAEEASKKKEKGDANASLALLRRVTCVGLKTANRERGAGVAVACGSLGDLAIFVDCSDRLVRTSLRDLANAHAAADAVAAAFDAADDAADAASRALFVSTRAELFEASPGSHPSSNSENAFDFDSALDAIRLLETHAARRHVAETTCRRRYRGGDGCLTRVGDLAGAFFLASSFASEEDSEEEKTDEKAETKATVCAAAAVLVHVAHAAGLVAGVGGVAVVPRAARDALAALSEAAEAVEAREKEKAEETELAEAMGIFPKHRRTQDEDLAEAARLSSRRREAAFEAARAAAPLWSARVGSRSENASTPREKTSRGIVAVVSLLVRGEDGRDTMRANAVDLLLGPERDLGDVEASLRVTSAPLAYALASERNADESEIFTTAAFSLWLWTASCVAIWRVRRVVRSTSRPGVFDLVTVDHELRRRRKAASVLGRYWRSHAERFFSNAKARGKRRGLP